MTSHSASIWRRAHRPSRFPGRQSAQTLFLGEDGRNANAGRSPHALSPLSFATCDCWLSPSWRRAHRPSRFPGRQSAQTLFLGEDGGSANAGPSPPTLPHPCHLPPVTAGCHPLGVGPTAPLDSHADRVHKLYFPAKMAGTRTPDRPPPRPLKRVICHLLLLAVTCHWSVRTPFF